MGRFVRGCWNSCCDDGEGWRGVVGCSPCISIES